MKRLVMSVLALMVLLVTLLGAVSPAAAAWDCGQYTNHFGMHFTKELPPAYWAPGVHTYTYAIWNSSTGTYDYITQNFKAVTGTPLYFGQAFMRLAGVRTSSGYVTAISPSQDTLFQVSYLLTANYAESVTLSSTYAVWVRWDSGAWTQLKPSKVMRWCEISPENPASYTRIWDYDY